MPQKEIIDKYKVFPAELKQAKQFVCWVGADKIPKNPHTGNNAQSNNKSTWGTFDEAVVACEKYKFDGIGFMFAPPYFGVDLDHCMDNLDFVDEFVETLQSYAEISKSGNGIHIICKGKLPDGSRRRGMIHNSSSIDQKRGRFYPLAMWKRKECLDYIKYHKLYYSQDQREKKKGSFGSLHGENLYIIREYYPEDYERILQLYPFAGAGVKRYEEYLLKGENKDGKK